MTSEVEPKTPPMEWYTGIAFPGEGIRRVMVGTDTFSALHWDLDDQMTTWCHSRLRRHETEFRSPKLARLNQDAGAFVQQVTGFAPEVLTRYAKKLEKMYIGQSMGPFPFPVTWIEK